MTTHGIGTSLLVLAVSLLIGGLAIHVGAKLAFAAKDYADAVLTALLGAVAWTVVDIAFAAVGIGGLFASIAGLLVWISVVRWQYSVGWIRAAIVGVGAWLSALVVLGILGIVGVGGLDAFGVPGA
ncbi:hypothetical protein GRX03_11160 [Halovenus sp. WSH3]|uniref:Uncharacterized protein n=1 Tax=Halovenus carboxidivorans TaxID=2692199 RepID=A0A6B0T7H0_9EURY|nr:hypothetical protein [Halovenus carboxidivorans]MXR52156.1 hypothetical protein [Halovenus carboxidivorans]